MKTEAPITMILIEAKGKRQKANGKTIKTVSSSSSLYTD